MTVDIIQGTMLSNQTTLICNNPTPIQAFMAIKTGQATASSQQPITKPSQHVQPMNIQQQPIVQQQQRTGGILPSYMTQQGAQQQR